MKRKVADEKGAIDAVILWVDGSDPEHAAKRRKYATGTAVEANDDIAGATRFADNGEIRWCVRSIERFAPWVRKIFIVTDGQDPQVRTDHLPVEIVDHQVVFRGYEQYLPTFNSLSLETMLWRIPGLSDRYIYFNDDFSLLRPVSPADFFDEENLPIVYGHRHLTVTAQMERLFERIKHPGKPAMHWRNGMLNAALLLKRREFFKIQHVPHGIRRDVMERWCLENPHAMERNASFRFRDESQFNPQELQYLLCAKKVNPDKELLMVISSRHQEVPAKPHAKFVCVNGFDKFTETNKQAVIKFMHENLYGAES